MKLKMLIHLRGTHDDEAWPEIGETVEISHPGVIDDLVRNGYAEIVAEPKPKLAATASVETVEAAPAPENAAVRTAKAKPRAAKPKQRGRNA